MSKRGKGIAKSQKSQKIVVSQKLREENFKKKKWSTLSNIPRNLRKTKAGVKEELVKRYKLPVIR